MNTRLIVLAASILAAGTMGFAQNNKVQQAAEDAVKAFSNAPEIIEKINYWDKKAIVDFGVTNTMLRSWAAGGNNTITLNGGIDATANYKKEMMNWNNRLQLQYAFLFSDNMPGIVQKTNDRIYLESKWSYRTAAKSKWNYTASLDFRSQFSDSYKFGGALIDDPKKASDYNRTLQSGRLAPGYLNVSTGMEWNPNAWFNVNIAPFSAGFTVCTIPELRKQYGMKLIEGSEDEYDNILFQFGAQVKANFKFTFNEVFNFESQVVVFSDYLNNPKNMRVNWDNKITWQISKLFKIGFNTWLIYDPIVMIKDDAHPEGIQKIQLKEYLSVNLTYTFTPRKK